MDGTTDSRSLTSIDLIRGRATSSPSGIATYHRDPSGTWVPSTWGSLWQDVERAAAALRTLGLQRGDRLAIMSHTCREWQIAEFAAALVGAVVVGIDAHGSPQQAEFIIARACAVGLIADEQTTLNRISPDTLARFRFVLLFRRDSEHGPSVQTWDHALASASDARPSTAGAPQPDDPAVLIFTSGTTGEPKGIEYSHRQVMTAAWAMVDAYHTLAAGRLVCWLPMAALFQRMMNLVGFGNGSVTYFVDDPREIVARLPEVKPTALTSVPRFYEKVHDGIRERLDTQTGLQKRLVDRALRAGDRWSRATREGQSPGLLLTLEHSVLDALVLRRIRAALGGELKALISGSAATPVWLLDFYFSLGLPVFEAYGVTENPIPVAGNRPGDFRLGSVGRPFTGNDVRLSDDGEVLVKGPAMFRYYEGEARRPEHFTSDGYYRTGDSGRFDSDGYLYLTGRLSEIIKTSTGRKVAPVAVESVYGRSRYVDQIVVVGNNRPFLTALIAPNRTAIEAALNSPRAEQEREVEWDEVAARDLVSSDLERLGATLAGYERIRSFAFLPNPLNIERGELTPTLKLRRARVEAAYRDLIERMYAAHAPQAAAR